MTGSSAAQPLFAVGWRTAIYTNSSVLYRIDDYYTNTPKAVRVGDTSQLLNGFAIDSTTGIFYAVGEPSPFRLVQLNPTNGLVTTTNGNIALPIRGLAFDRTGQLFGLGTDRLYRVNKTNGLPTPLPNPVGLALGAYSDIAFDTNGVLFASTTTQLIRIDTNSGVGTLVGSFGANDFFGLEVDSDGIMYAARGNGNGGTNAVGLQIDTGLTELYIVNKSNGAASLIRQIDCADGFSVNGLSFLGNTNQPVQPTNGIFRAVEVEWKSESNRLYQVQWSTNVNAGFWSNLGGWVLGNGSTNFVFDSTRGAQQRFYRTVALP